MVLEIQACMPSPPATFRPYMRGVYIAYMVVSWAYFGVAFTGAPYALEALSLAVAGNICCLVFHLWTLKFVWRLHVCLVPLSGAVHHATSEQERQSFKRRPVAQPHRRVASAGYWAYGSSVQSNILFSLEHPKGVIALASAMGACRGLAHCLATLVFWL